MYFHRGAVYSILLGKGGMESSSYGRHPRLIVPTAFLVLVKVKAYVHNLLPIAYIPTTHSSLSDKLEDTSARTPRLSISTFMLRVLPKYPSSMDTLILSRESLPRTTFSS